MDIKSIINRKREKKELSEEEIRFFIFSYFKNEILEEQAAALLTLIYTNGITEKEMAYLTMAMSETGEELDLYKISNSIIDFHPIGGIEDKIIIVLMCIIASLNIPIAKVLGRELGLEDRLSAIPNYKVDSDIDMLSNLLKETNIGIIAEPNNIAPVEEKLYRLRNNIACNDDISLITMSIMSQKLAIGAKNVVFDITYGQNAYVKTYEKARKMAVYFSNIGKNVNRNVKCVISSFNEPIGRYFGNILEIEEIIDILHNKMTDDVEESIIIIGTIMLKMLNINNNEKQCKDILINSIKSGKAFESFVMFLKYKGINIDQIINREKEKYIVPIVSNENGYVQEIDLDQIRNTGIYLNAIKQKKDDKLDIGAGISFFKKVGDTINKGDIIGYIHTNNETKITNAVNNLQRAYMISTKKINKKSRIIGII